MGLFRRRDEPSPAARAEPAPAATPRQWADIPVVSRVTGDIEPTIDTRFDRRLTTWQSPGVLRPLDHAVTTDGPTGLVLQATTRSAAPAPPRGPSTHSVPRMVQFEPPQRPSITSADVDGLAPVALDALDGLEPATEAATDGSDEPGPEATSPAPAPALYAATEPAAGPLLSAAEPTVGDADTTAEAIQRAAAAAEATMAASDTPVAPILADDPDEMPPRAAGGGAGAPVLAAIDDLGPSPSEPRSLDPDVSAPNPVRAVAPGDSRRAATATPLGLGAPRAGSAAGAGADVAPPAVQRSLLDAPLVDVDETLEASPLTPPGEAVAEIVGGSVSASAGAAVSETADEPVGSGRDATPDSVAASVGDTVGDTASEQWPLLAAPAVATAAPRPAPAGPPSSVQRTATGATTPTKAPRTRPPAGMVGPPIERPAGSATPPPVSRRALAPADDPPVAGEPRVTPDSDPGPAGAPIGEAVTPGPGPALRFEAVPLEAVRRAPTPAGPPASDRVPSPPVQRASAGEPARRLEATAPLLPTTVGLHTGTPRAPVPPSPAREPTAVSAPVGLRQPTMAVTTALQRVVASRPPQSAASAPTAPAPDVLPRDTPSGRVDAGAVAVAAGVARREPDGSVVFRSVAAAEEPAGADPPTADDADGPVAIQAAPADGAGGGAPAATTAAPAAPGAPGPDLDELAKRLYGRLRVMLKHELRLERERAGLLTQTRR